MKVLEVVSTAGPGRRAGVSVVEMVLLAENGEAAGFEVAAARLQQQLPARLETLGLEIEPRDWASISSRNSAAGRLAGYVCTTALALQNAAGFDLQFQDFLQDADPQTGQQRYRFLFEHDDKPSGEQAGDLALCLAAEACPELHWQALLHDMQKPLDALVATFIASAREFVAPPESLALLAAARQRGIPFLRLEREPYGPLQASFRVAPNGMVMLGHACHQVILDGLLCVSRPGPGFSVMQDRKALLNLLAQLGATHPALFDAGPSSYALEVLYVGGRPLAARQHGQLCEPPADVLPLCQRVVAALACGIALLQLDSGGQAGGFAVTGLDLSPPLESWLAGNETLRKAAYDGLLDWLFPPGTDCRIPIVSITGTNGKTTTSTIIARMAEATGFHVGVARTTGVTLDGEHRETGDHSGIIGHSRVLECRKVDFAVLETARGDVLRSGFIFDHSDVAICTNVTAEHLGEHGIETVEDMAGVKRLVLERSRGAVALNADDPLCLGMLPGLQDRSVYLTSLHQSRADLRERVQRNFRLVHVGSWQGEDWILLDLDGVSTPLIAIKDVPATFNGLATHNISNVLHAVCAAMALDFSLETIRQVLRTFTMEFENLPGRLNMHHNGQIQIIMDNAHNADGLAKLAKFTDRLPCSGRKILRFGVSNKATVAAAFRAGSAAAGHYDHYICSDLPRDQPFDASHLIEGLRQGLLANGVAPECIEVFTDREQSVSYPVSLCQPGDLLVLVTSTATLASTWQKIIRT